MSALVMSGLCPSNSITTPACSTDIACAVLLPTLNQVPTVLRFHRGIVIDRTNSEFINVVFRKPVKNSLIGTCRCASTDSISTDASRATNAEMVSLAGLAVTIFPTTVARLRSWGEPISMQADRRMSRAESRFCASIIWLCVTPQPMTTSLSSIVISEQSGNPQRSIRVTGEPFSFPELRDSSKRRSVAPATGIAAGIDA